MTNAIELTKNVIIICNLIIEANSNNINRPVVNVNSIISCNNLYNEPLVINKTKQDINNKTTESNNVYIINDSDVKIND